MDKGEDKDKDKCKDNVNDNDCSITWVFFFKRDKLSSCRPCAYGKRASYDNSLINEVGDITSHKSGETDYDNYWLRDN